MMLFTMQRGWENKFFAEGRTRVPPEPTLDQGRESVSLSSRVNTSVANTAQYTSTYNCTKLFLLSQPTDTVLPTYMYTHICGYTVAFLHILVTRCCASRSHPWFNGENTQTPRDRDTDLTALLEASGLPALGLGGGVV